MSVYDYTFRAIDGSELPMSKFRGQAVLVVNTASGCELTPQYEALEALYRRYKDRGLVVLGVPANDFKQQEPGADADILAFCTTRYDISFPLTSKEHVVGDATHPFFRWVLEELGQDAAPRWNFHKYLVGRNGVVANAFGSRTVPNAPEIISAIERALG